MKNRNRKFIFIYNAESGFINGILDSAHKLLAPQSYSCDLCALTHGTFGMKNEWKAFIDEYELDLIFYHKDEIPKSLEHFDLPVILDCKGEMEIVSSIELRKLSSLENLINTFKLRIN